MCIEVKNVNEYIVIPKFLLVSGNERLKFGASAESSEFACRQYKFLISSLNEQNKFLLKANDQKWWKRAFRYNLGDVS